MNDPLEQMQDDIKDIRRNHLVHIEKDMSTLQIDVAVLKQIAGEHRKLLWVIFSGIVGILIKSFF